MVVNVEKKIKDKANIEVNGATLLSVEEAKALPKHLRVYSSWWWLRSPGNYSFSVAFVNYVGTVFNRGNNVDDSRGAVRPALKIANLESSSLKIGDSIFFGGKEFEIISDTLAFCRTGIWEHCFREDWEAEDANDYKKSDVKKYIDEWFSSAVRAYTN